MRYLHTMIRVADLDKAVHFYCQVLGLQEHNRKDYPEGKFTLVFLGEGGATEPFLELTHNWESDKYEVGSGYGHMAFGVKDIYLACAEIQRAGGKVTRAPGPMKNSKSVIAFIEDPDGYKVELIQRDL